jgi:hypothetical protein
MKTATLAAVVLALAAAPAFAAKPCEELKAEIAKQLDDKHVAGYTLDIVPADQNVDAPAQVVGSCDGGKNKIVYTRK